MDKDAETVVEPLCVGGSGDAESPSSRPASAQGVSQRPPHRKEEIADWCVHALGVVASLAGLIGLVVAAWVDGDATRAASVLVYGVALVATLSLSAAYNVLRETPLGPRLRRADHAMIFVMIAATYTPFVVVKIGGAWGYGLLVTVWTVAAFGAAMKILCPHRLERHAVALYLILSWIIVVAWQPFIESVSRPAFVLIAAGGLLYSAGVLFFLWERLPYQRAIWHAFVLAAAACHFAAVTAEVAVPGTLS